jgi:hypothetical protein
MMMMTIEKEAAEEERARIEREKLRLHRREQLWLLRVNNVFKREIRETDRLINDFNENAQVTERRRIEQLDAGAMVADWWRIAIDNKKKSHAALRIPQAFWSCILVSDLEVTLLWHGHL